MPGPPRVASLPAVCRSTTCPRSWDTSDVPEGVHKPAIDALDALGVFEGTKCADGMFFTGDEMKRWTMGVAGAGPRRSRTARSRRVEFADVDSDEWWLAHVERLAELEVTKGRGCRPPLLMCGAHRRDRRMLGQRRKRPEHSTRWNVHDYHCWRHGERTIRVRLRIAFRRHDRMLGPSPRLIRHADQHAVPRLCPRDGDYPFRAGARVHFEPDPSWS